MKKYSLETKKNLIDLVFNRSYSCEEAAKKLGVNGSIARRWVKLYRYHGEDSFYLKSGTYSGEFKKNAVEYMYENNLSIQEASAMLGIPDHKSLSKWELIYNEEGQQALFVERRGRSKHMKKSEKSLNDNQKVKELKNNEVTKEELLSELECLRAEIAYLKKYNALVQTKKKSQIKKNQK